MISLKFQKILMFFFKLCVKKLVLTFWGLFVSIVFHVAGDPLPRITCFEQFTFFSVKAYIRKGAALMALREYGKAQNAYESALALDNNNQEARDGLMNAMSNNNEDPDAARERAMRDPEVQEILKLVF